MHPSSGALSRTRISQLSPPASSPAAESRMKRQARKDTEPELVIRQSLHAQGLRYRLQTPVPGLKRRSIDICFRRAKVAVFVDGCFWHGCPVHGTTPAANSAWWSAKIERNRRRDAETTRHLTALGWTVLRYWEHAAADQVVAEVLAVLESRQPRL
jgi:DNA mismatch endonuclease (patch repair protein)